MAKFLFKKRGRTIDITQPLPLGYQWVRVPATGRMKAGYRAVDKKTKKKLHIFRGYKPITARTQEAALRRIERMR